MLSRRSVRVKVLQVLYALNRDSSLGEDKSLKMYKDSVEGTNNLFLLNLYAITKISAGALEDEKKRKSKYLPTEKDKIFKPKLAYNHIVDSINNNKTLQKAFKKLEFDDIEDQDYYDKIYFAFAKEVDTYYTYLEQSITSENTVNIFLELYRYCRKNDLFNDLMELKYPSWEDDKSIVIGTVKKVLKDLPYENENFFLEFSPDNETVTDFGQTLLKIVMAHQEELMEVIKPKLENWDHDRLAIIDTLLMQMGIVEFRSFETIPPNITINEYVELAKKYSTAKSHEFIYAVLESILNELKAADLINKKNLEAESDTN